jgi:Ca2+-transporting ATPase
VLERCTHWRAGAEERALGAAERAAVERWNAELADRGLRVLALARGVRPAGAGGPPAEGDVRDLRLLGLVGLLDPPADGVVETVRRLAAAGVRTVMITGDQAPTARAVARELGLAAGDGSAGEVLDARAVAALDEAALAARLDRVVAFSRMAPEQKLRVVRAFRARGEAVAMLGDGVNDAAALKGADVGVAMGGRGTDVAKETADVVLADDRFETIGAAVEGGRTIYDNIGKFVFYLLSGNLAEVAVMLVAGLVGWPPPLRPLQILWINLVSDVFPALALAVEPAEPDVMRRPPQDPARPLFSRRLLGSCALHAAAITAPTLVAYGAGLAAGAPERAGAAAFLVLGLAQVLHVFNARSARPILLSRRVLANGWLWAAVAGSTALMLATVAWPALSRVLATRPPGAGDWLAIGLLSAVPLALGQAGRALVARRRAAQ